MIFPSIPLPLITLLSPCCKQITWKHKLPCILHLLEIYKSLFTVTTTPYGNLCISSLLAFKWRLGFFLFSVTLYLQSLIALGFWSLLESLSPAKRSTELAMLLDRHYWSKGALLRKDYSLSSPCHCCLACVPFLQMDTMTWKKSLDWNKTRRKKKEKKSIAFPIKAVD